MQKSKENQPMKKRKRAGSKGNESDDDYDDDSDAEIANDIESDDFDDTKIDDDSDEGWSDFLRIPCGSFLPIGCSAIQYKSAVWYGIFDEVGFEFIVEFESPYHSEMQHEWCLLIQILNGLS